MAIAPHKTDSPLIIDSDRVLPFPIASQCLQLITRRRSQDTQLCGSVQLEQFSQGDPFDRSKAFGMLVLKKLFGLLRAKALNHTPIVPRTTLYVKRR
jgi:hypothetical protein